MSTGAIAVRGRPGMQRMPGGVFLMGSDDHYPEEKPARPVSVDPFWIDEIPVTNAAFAAFVEATGYVTQAEIAPSAADYPDADRAMLKAGSAVFTKTAGPIPLTDPAHWWAFTFGADWRHPWGPLSDLRGLADHPVVHVTCADAEAYAAWAGKRLPTEAEWEFAARGGLEGAAFAWGSDFEPGGRPQANYWQGRFPFENLRLDGYERTSPVRAFAPNGYGLFDMIGNAWELTADPYDQPPAAKACCTTSKLGAPGPRRVMKGGSHLCAETYCRRYRPAARYAQALDTSTSHVGFRCATNA